MSVPEISVPQYRMYIDESGDHQYNRLEDVSSRYLALLGCIFDRKGDYELFSKGLETIKRRYWPHVDPDKPVIFHREDMVRRRKYFTIFKDTQVLEKFNRDYLNLLRESKYTVICVTIDKKSHLERYKYPAHPYYYCLVALLERYVLWLKSKSSTGDVMAESRGPEDLPLKAEYRRIWFDAGSSFMRREEFQRHLSSREIKIKPKINNLPGLQVADSLAYPMREKILFSNQIRDNFRNTFSETIYKEISDKIRRQPITRAVRGWGEVFIK